MRQLLRCRRGAAAFATVVALVPLVGFVALGGEAGSWYVTKQNAQNAADSAATSGALKLACTLSGSCNDTFTVAYRGMEFAARNGFCNTGDATISFQGSPNINAPNCGMASNNTASRALDFTGGGMSVNLGVLSAAGGCTGGASFCNSALTYRPPISNPFAALDSALTNLCGSNPGLPATCGLPNCPKGSGPLVPYTAANKCTNNDVTISGNTTALTAGVYFISGLLSLKGNALVTGTDVTFILLPGASINTKGGGTFTITGPKTAPATGSLPPAFQAYAYLFQYMGLYDASATPVQFGGTSKTNITGNIYAPTAAVTFQGDPVIRLSGGAGCGELIAASVTFNGNTTLDLTGCSTATKPTAQYVSLVQ